MWYQYGGIKAFFGRGGGLGRTCEQRTIPGNPYSDPLCVIQREIVEGGGFTHSWKFWWTEDIRKSDVEAFMKDSTHE